MDITNDLPVDFDSMNNDIKEYVKAYRDSNSIIMEACNGLLGEKIDEQRVTEPGLGGKKFDMSTTSTLRLQQLSALKRESLAMDLGVTKLEPLARTVVSLVLGSIVVPMQGELGTASAKTLKVVDDHQ